MPGGASVRDFVDNGLTFGAGDGHLSVGHAKIMVTASAGAMNPSAAELREIVAERAALGFPVAIHAVESEVVRAAGGRYRRESHAGSRRPAQDRALRGVSAGRIGSGR